MNKIMSMNGANVILLDTDTSKALKKVGSIEVEIDSMYYTITFDKETKLVSVSNAEGKFYRLVDKKILERNNMKYIGSEGLKEITDKVIENGSYNDGTYTYEKAYDEKTDSEVVVCHIDRKVSNVIVR